MASVVCTVRHDRVRRGGSVGVLMPAAGTNDLDRDAFSYDYRRNKHIFSTTKRPRRIDFLYLRDEAAQRVSVQRSGLIFDAPVAGRFLSDHFGIQTVAWGAFDLALAATGLQRLELRDLAGATRLDRFLWLNIGLDVGYVMVGMTLLVLGWRMARRMGFVGAGMAVVVQGSALALLDLVLANQISR